MSNIVFSSVSFLTSELLAVDQQLQNVFSGRFSCLSQLFWMRELSTSKLVFQERKHSLKAQFTWVFLACTPLKATQCSILEAFTPGSLSVFLGCVSASVIPAVDKHHAHHNPQDFLIFLCLRVFPFTYDSVLLLL